MHQNQWPSSESSIKKPSAIKPNLRDLLANNLLTVLQDTRQFIMIIVEPKNILELGVDMELLQHSSAIQDTAEFQLNLSITITSNKKQKKYNLDRELQQKINI